jgi:histidinol-phosphate aminotransferase
MAVTPEQLIRDEIRALAAYHVPDSRGMIKLDAMENPYRLPSEVDSEIAAVVAAAPLNRYPDPHARSLKQRLRESMSVPEGMELLIGNGSDELIQMLAVALARPGAVLLSVEPSFVLFRMIASFTGMRYVGVPLGPGFALDLPAMEAALLAHRPALTFLAYPNNPTGNLFDAQAMERIIALSPGLVVADEAYHAFAGRSFLPRLSAYPNLLVMRTLSKLGLAGLRLGMLMGRPEWLREVDKVRLPYNVNVLSQGIAEVVLRHSDVLEGQAGAIRAERARLFARLSAMAGVQAYPSEANFILFRVSRADTVFAGLKTRGVLIKNLNGSHPMLADCLRVTVGTQAENDAFIDALGVSLPRAA